MVRALHLRLDPNTTAIYALDWSGRNSPAARREAAVVLNKYLNDLNLEFAAVPITLVAHSHGGNIALAAVAIASVNNASVVCLSTPFLRTHPRTFPKSSELMLVLLVVMLTIVFATAVVILSAHSLGLSGFDEFKVAIGCADLVAAIVAINFLKRLARWLQRARVKLRQRVGYSVEPTLRLLIVRMTDDEASMSLMAYRFVEWLLNKYAVCFDNLFIPWKGRVVVICLCFGLFYFGGWDYTAWLLLWAVVGMVVSLFLPLLITFLAIGGDACLGLIGESISIDATPVGHWSVHLFDAGPATKGLAHSQTYADARCIRLVADWIGSVSCPEVSATPNVLVS